MSFDPAITIGRVKELVWNAWPAGQGLNPSVPDSIVITVLLHRLAR
jgi:hypothetical protein